MPFILLATLWISSTALSRALDALQLKRAQITPGESEKAVTYLRDHTRLNHAAEITSLILSLGWIFLGGFDWADRHARSIALGIHSGWGAEILAGLIFVGILGLLRQLVSLPFVWISIFGIEAKYGFNRMTPRLFFMDLGRGLFLSALLGGPLFAIIQTFFLKLGSAAEWVAWIGVTVFQIIMTFLAPSILMPLFNRFEPLPENTPDQLSEKIRKLASNQGFGLQGIFTMDGSKRSSKANAFFAGFGKTRRLVLFDTLLEKLSPSEILGVVAHEIGHYRLGHIPRSLAVSIGVTGATFWILGHLLQSQALYEAFHLSTPSIYSGLICGALVIGRISRFFSWAPSLLSRKHEFEADAFAGKVTQRPEDLITALEKLSKDHLSVLHPHPLKVFFDYSHPPLEARTRALRQARS